MKRYLFIFVIILCLGAGQANAASVRAEASPLLLPGLVEIGVPFTVDIYMNNNDGFDHTGYSIPFAFYSPDGSIISVTHRNVSGFEVFDWRVQEAVYDSSILMLNGFDTLWAVFNQWTGFSWDGALPDTINNTAASVSGWAHGLGEKLYLQFAFEIDQEGTFCIDSVGVPGVSPPGMFDWLFDYETNFNGPYCWEVGPLPEDPEIGVDPDSLQFEGVAGQSPPPAQLLKITNTGVGTLNWTGSWNSSWLGMSPAFGTAPSNVQVYVSTVGLEAGVHYDTITVSDPNATNDPVLVPVRLTVFEPPPTIGLSQTYFSFTGIADSANPPDQILTVTNIGGGTLEWTASNSESWLSIYPGFGTDSGDVTLSVDITGLTFGIYYDTVVVSDPDATNDPQIAEVRLEVASSFPLLAVEPSLIYVIVDVDNPWPDDRQFTVYNSGGGSMNYYVEEHSPRISSLDPDSGSVPQVVTVHFDSVACINGQVFLDTVWIHSIEAVNSPQIVIFRFECYTEPAVLVVSKDSIVADLYECGQGMPPPAFPNFTVYSASTRTFAFELTYNSDWLAPDPVSGQEPQIITVEFDYKELSPGTYYDTIVVTADEAMNSPQILPVTLSILATDTPAEIVVARDNEISFIIQENRQGMVEIITVNNRMPGCMEWEIQEDILWVDFLVDSTHDLSYPWIVTVMPNAFGIVLGHYFDTAHVVSPSASNSPYPIYLDVQVWKFHGDCDYNGRLNILDINYLIYYLYRDGPAPKPTLLVGDCNCDGVINLLDLNMLINYIYGGGPPLCGNPY